MGWIIDNFLDNFMKYSNVEQAHIGENKSSASFDALQGAPHLWPTWCLAVLVTAGLPAPIWGAGAGG